MDQKDLILEDYVSGILGDLLEQLLPAEGRILMNGTSRALKDEVFTRFGVDILAEGVKPDTLNRQELGDEIFEKLQASGTRKRRS